jgi:hypothetical protein
VGFLIYLSSYDSSNNSSIQKKKLDLLAEELEAKGMNISQAETILLEAADLGESMVKKGFAEIKKITDKNKKDWKDSFNENELILNWFGKVDNKSQVKKVRNRMDSICNRLIRELKIRFRPQKERTHYARNRGIFFEPSTFKVLDEDIQFIPSTYIHELVYVWFKDQRLGTEIVYGEQPALDLAKYHPRRVRKSAENFAFFL